MNGSRLEKGPAHMGSANFYMPGLGSMAGRVELAKPDTVPAAVNLCHSSPSRVWG